MLCVKYGRAATRLHNLTFQTHIPANKQTNKYMSHTGSDNHATTTVCSANTAPAGVANDRTAVA